VVRTQSSSAEQTFTDQTWGFNTNPAPDFSDIPPDTFNNPFGLPTVDALPMGSTGATWTNMFDGHQGVLVLAAHAGDVADVLLNNAPTPDMPKTVTVTIIYQFPNAPGLLGANPPTISSPFGPFNMGIPTDGALGDGTNWNIFTSKYNRSDCPPLEAISIMGKATSDLYIDSISVHTECIPEPSALGLFGLGLLGLLGYGWYHHRQAPA
jgi:hypothetical protein